MVIGATIDTNQMLSLNEQARLLLHLTCHATGRHLFKANRAAREIPEHHIRTAAEKDVARLITHECTGAYLHNALMTHVAP